MIDIESRQLFNNSLQTLKESSLDNSISRENMEYALVYNKDKAGFEKVSQECVHNHVFDRVNEEIVLCKLGKYKGLYLKDVHTYSKEKFESKFIARYCQEYAESI